MEPVEQRERTRKLLSTRYCFLICVQHLKIYSLEPSTRLTLYPYMTPVCRITQENLQLYEVQYVLMYGQSSITKLVVITKDVLQSLEVTETNGLKIAFI